MSKLLTLNLMLLLLTDIPKINGADKLSPTLLNLLPVTSELPLPENTRLLFTVKLLKDGSSLLPKLKTLLPKITVDNKSKCP